MTEKRLKQKIKVSNKVAVITLEGEAFQLVYQIIRDAGYRNLVKEIVKNTKIETKP